MPEQDIERLFGKALVDPVFQEELLDPYTRESTIRNEKSNITAEELDILLEIDADTLDELAQRYLDHRLPRRRRI